MSKQQICVNLDKALIQRIDRNRGDVPRSRVVERALSQAMGEMGTSEKVGVEG